MAEESTLVSPEQAPGQRLRPKGRRRTDLPFPDFIKGKLDRIDRLNEQEEKRRIQTYVTLTRRYRGDLLGFFASDNSGTWIPCNNRGLKRVNVVAPVVRANNKNWMEAQIKLEVTASNSDPEVAGAADLGQSIIDMVAKRDWNEHFEEMISELAQLSAAYFVYSRYNKELGPKIKVPRMAQKDVTIPGKYVCQNPNCGSVGQREKAELTGGCPEGGCGAPVTLTDPIVMPRMQVPDGYDEQPGGDTESVLFTSYEMKVDERNAKGGDLSNCRFIRNNYLVYRNELEMIRPWALLDGKGGDWSEGLRQARALEITSAQTGDSLSSTDGMNDLDEDLLDYRRYWLSKKSLAGYVCPADYTHGDAAYGYSFTIKEGQTLDEVFEEEGFEGLYVERQGEEVLIYDNEDFRNKWTVGHWQMDATTFWGKAQEDLLDLQEMRIEMVNIFFQAGMSMSLPPLIIDGRMFDGEDFVNDPGAIVYTRKGFDTGTRGIGDFIHQMFPQGPGPEMFGFYNLLVQSTDESSGVAPVSVGQGDPANKTAHGQQLLAQRSVGLLVPSQKNKAKAKVEWAYQQLELIQKYWTPGRYVPIKTKYGEEWKQADIAAFRNINIREQLVIGYVEGSENPMSLEQRAENIGLVLSSGILENPAIPVQLKQMVFRLAGIDYDIDNFEAEIRLCNARLRRMEKVIGDYEQRGLAWVIDEEGMPATDPYENPIVNLEAVKMVLNAPGCQVIPESDNHAIHAEFWADQLKAEAAKDDADPFKIAVFRSRIQEQAFQASEAGKTANALALNAQGPVMDKQTEMGDEESAKQTDREEKSKDSDAARQIATQEAMGPKSSPAVSAPAISA